MTLKGIVSRLTYKPNWRFYYSEIDDRLIVTVEATVRDSNNPTQRITIRKSMMFEQRRTNQERFLLDLKYLIQDMEDHETKEWFRLDGVCIDQPH